MGCDIHWLMERKDAEGKWHPVCTNGHAFHLISKASNDELFSYIQHPAFQARTRSYVFFSALADVRNPNPRPEKLLYEEELPEDINENTRAWLLDDSDLHSPGWASPQRIKQWDTSWAGWKMDEAEERELSQLIDFYRKNILLLPTFDILNQQILRVPFYCDEGEPDYGTIGASAHQRMEDTITLKNMPTASDDTVRFFFAFDN